jgi:hypothetical protein
LAESEETGAPIEGAMVILLDAGGHLAARTLTDRQGRFSAQVPQTGSYRAQVDRIGHESTTTDPFDVPSEGTFLRISIPIRPVELEGLDVSASRQCKMREEVGRATATLWEEARKVLEATAWTQESGRYRYTLLRTERQLDESGERTLSEKHELARGYAQVPYLSIPPQVLADSGFVRQLPDDSLLYSAPDAEVLLSDAFAGTHCLRVVAGDDGLLGLAFEPAEGRELPDIQGVLWIKAATSMLHRLEFRYVNLAAGRTAGDAGGEVVFWRLPAGAWIVRDWRILAPLYEPSGRGRLRRFGYHEIGGSVLRVVDPAGTIVWDVAPTQESASPGDEGQQVGALTGRVLDDLTGQPIPSATVAIIGNDSVALATSWTYSDGSFHLPVLTSGTFRIRAEQLSYKAAMSGPMELGTGSRVGIELRLTPAPLMIDSLLVNLGERMRPLQEGEQLVYGRLLDNETRRPIEGGVLNLLTERRVAAVSNITSVDGQFWLVSPRAGTYMIQGDRLGYRRSKSPPIHLMLGDSIGIDFYLSKNASIPSPLTVTASRRTWSDRVDLTSMEDFLVRHGRFARFGYGGFMTREAIAQWEGRVSNVSDMLRATMFSVRDVVRIHDSANSDSDLAGAVMMYGERFSGGLSQGVCIPRYYLDGAPVPYILVSGFGPGDLEAVEVYVSPQIPAEFLSGFPCGVVAYWSRRSPGGQTSRRSLWTKVFVAAMAVVTILVTR